MEALPEPKPVGRRWRHPCGRVVWNLEQVWAGHRAREVVSEPAPLGHRARGTLVAGDPIRGMRSPVLGPQPLKPRAPAGPSF